MNKVMTWRPAILASCTLAFLTPTALGDGLIDQENAPPWTGGWTHVNPGSLAGQTFCPRRASLVGVDVNVLTANAGRGGDTLSVSVLDQNETLIAYATKFVEEGFDGWLHFDLPDVPLGIGATYVLRLAGTGRTVFGWRYVGGDAYPCGTSQQFGEDRALLDYLFRTYSANPCIRNIDRFLAACPDQDPAYDTLRADFELRRNGTVVGDVPCQPPASELPIDEFTDELIALQVLRFIYYMDFGRSDHLPWAPDTLYE